MINQYEAIAERAIAQARADLGQDTIALIIDDADTMAGINGYIARQIDGESVGGRTSAEVEIQSAKADIWKKGRNKRTKTVDADAIKALDKLTSFEHEYLRGEADEDED